MKTVNIKLTLTEDIKDFVRITSKYNYDIDLRSGRYTIDAKSILGIFSLDLSKPIAMDVYDDHCDDLLEDIKPFEV
jgi:alpha-D-ribose 1-methylphosphonate 5-phosphate C-P lyase